MKGGARRKRKNFGFLAKYINLQYCNTVRLEVSILIGAFVFVILVNRTIFTDNL